jgi:hypothetical protein
MLVVGDSMNARLAGRCNSRDGIRVGEELASCGAKPRVGDMRGVTSSNLLGFLALLGSL